MQLPLSFVRHVTRYRKQKWDTSHNSGTSQGSGPLVTTTKEHPRIEAVKAALPLNVAGDDVLDVFEEDESKDDYAKLAGKFQSYCANVSNKVHERYVFRSRKQAEGEPFEKFVRDLKRQAAQCNFVEQQGSQIRDQIVFGTNDSKLREKKCFEKSL
ncbi:hypothetical protein HPB52_020187 [Rhipicephalus sanguineus]|uniref:Uncharacterized protein n=1 Tax=Rhipicephalus sanguineus TaxID=34632 RepID=A0A9D4STA5_RHISA|nr:hypothetical protein HPB52_020187 [Rhipicephalus sanguineus]